MTDKVVLDLADNEELAEYITSKSPGDECEMEIKATLDELTDDQAVFSIKDVSVEHAETEEEEEGEEEDEDSPVMAVMMAGGKEKEDSY